MGLIDDVRDRKDSWSKRYEEHRSEKEEYDHRSEEQNEKSITEKIRENCKNVGNFKPLGG